MQNLQKEKKHSVVFADRFFMTDEAIREIEHLGKIFRVNYTTENEMANKLQQVKPTVIISEYFNVSGRLFDSSPKLKGVVVWGVGYDHIDVEAASERGVYVTNTRGSNAESVAEHVFALMISLSRRLLKNDKFVRDGGWLSREETGLPQEMRAHDIYGKTLGIVGLGAIGSRVARIAHGFEMHVLAYDPYLDSDEAKKRGAELVPINTLLKESDFVTLHTILNEETRGMIRTKELDLMKPTAFLINTSRGPVIDEESLIAALKKKMIAGAGLDVFSIEPINLASPLLKFENVLLTPHCAGNSKEALESTSLIVSQETNRILSGQIPKNLVNRKQLLSKGFT